MHASGYPVPNALQRSATKGDHLQRECVHRRVQPQRGEGRAGSKIRRYTVWGNHQRVVAAADAGGPMAIRTRSWLWLRANSRVANNDLVGTFDFSGDCLSQSVGRKRSLPIRFESPMLPPRDPSLFKIFCPRALKTRGSVITICISFFFIIIIKY